VLITREDVKKLCHLARLEISSKEIEDVSMKLSDIVDMVNELRTAETSSVLPMAHPLDQAQRMRKDKVTEVDNHEQYQKNAPLVDKDLYLVPKVLE
tara:strand:- start:484 stop:771 length:288 start_codon:yes stop_codon:yes gene_type:complete